MVWKTPPITLADRLATAVVCVLAMAATGGAIGLLLLLDGGDVITAEGVEGGRGAVLVFVAFYVLATVMALFG